MTDSLTPETLKKILSYNPNTGVLTWKPRDSSFFKARKESSEYSAKKWNACWAGKPALASKNNQGYKIGAIFHKRYRAHRVIWAMVFGEWPSGEIDHINGNPSDNRIKNLRVVTAKENSKNLKKSIKNTSGTMGVYWYKRDCVWTASIKINGKNKHLGYFEKKSDAIFARKLAEYENGYHPNHGGR